MLISSMCLVDIMLISSMCSQDLLVDVMLISSTCPQDLLVDVMFISSTCPQDSSMDVRLKVYSYISRYPVHGTIQSALHFTPWQICSFQLLWEAFSHSAITA